MTPTGNSRPSGDWVRFSEYELVSGAIAPTADAELRRYNPWETFRANVGKYRTVVQPYVSLLELRRSLKDMEIRGVRPTPEPTRRTIEDGPILSPPTEADRLVLDWCRDYGLLGLFPVRANRVQLLGKIGDGGDPTRKVVTSTQYFRSGGRWDTQTSQTGHSAATPEQALTDATDMAAQTEPSVAWLNLVTHAYDDRPLAWFTLFWPRHRTDRDFIPPQPQTPDFWPAYGEPMWDFHTHCYQFAQAVHNLGRWPGERVPEPEQQTVNRSHAVLTALAETVSASFQHDPIRSVIREDRVSTGLLASYALMFLQDHKQGRRCLQCLTCDRYFVSNDRRSRYCSPSCRMRFQSRRHRLKVSGSGPEKTGVPTSDDA